LGGLLGQRAVRVDVDPHLATALDVAVDGDTSGLDLPVGDVRGLERLDAVLTERDVGAALGPALTAGVVLLAVLDALGDEHGQASLFSAGASAVAAEPARPVSVLVAVVPWEPERRGRPAPRSRGGARSPPPRLLVWAYWSDSRRPPTTSPL